MKVIRGRSDYYAVVVLLKLALDLGIISSKAAAVWDTIHGPRQKALWK